MYFTVESKGISSIRRPPPSTNPALIADTRVSAHPNAGLPNEMGEYDEHPDITSAHLGDWASEGIVNLVGGCCGTTPEHIKAIADKVADKAPRVIPEKSGHMQLAGLDPVTIIPVSAE